MTTLELPRTAFTPEVTFRYEAGTLAMSGECYPENPAAFFGPLMAAIERHFRAGGGETFDATFRLSYVNSASTKALRRILGILDAMGEHGTIVAVTWEHEVDDDMSSELGEDLAAGLHFIVYHARTFELRAAS